MTSTDSKHLPDPISDQKTPAFMDISQYNIAMYEQQLQDKLRRAQQLLVPYTEGIAAKVFRSPYQYFRQRVEFRIWHIGDECFYAMTDSETKKPLLLESFPPASKAINQCMPALLNMINHIEILKHKLFAVEFLSNQQQPDQQQELLITLIYHKPLDEHWRVAAEQLQEQLSADINTYIIGRSRKQKEVLSQDYLTEAFNVGGRVFYSRHSEGAFTQPNAKINTDMLGWVYEMSHPNRRVGRSDLLELYCGNGNFTLPLSVHYQKVLATEVSKSSIRDLNWAIEANHIDNLKAVRLSAAEAASALSGERKFRRLADIDLASYQFETIFVDPPRAGVDAQTIAFLSRFENIIYISCNPDSLAENLQALSATHAVTDAAWFDQFPFSNHLEAGVVLQRNKR